MTSAGADTQKTVVTVMFCSCVNTWDHVQTVGRKHTDTASRPFASVTGASRHWREARGSI